MVFHLPQTLYSFYLITATACTANYSFGWHGYDYNKSRDTECENLTDAHRNTNFTEAVNKYKLWRLPINYEEVTSDDLLYGFDKAMQTIWDNQVRARVRGRLRTRVSGKVRIYSNDMKI